MSIIASVILEQVVVQFRRCPELCRTCNCLNWIYWYSCVMDIGSIKFIGLCGFWFPLIVTRFWWMINANIYISSDEFGKPTYWRPVDWIVMINSRTMFIKFKRKLIPVLFIVYFSNFNSRKKYICTVTKQIY